MLNGTYIVGRVQEESICRSSKNYRFTDIGIYKIHSTTLMPNIPFDKAIEIDSIIDKSIFLNDQDTKLTIVNKTKTQNYLTSTFIGRAPLEWYNNNEFTKMGRKFILICKGGNPDSDYRIFGTEGAIRGYNKSAGDNVALPGGGE